MSSNLPEQDRRASSAAISILIADDQAIDRKGMALLLTTQPDFGPIYTAATADEAVSLCVRHRPRVMLMDVRMPGSGGLDAISKVAAVSPETRILAVAEHGEARCLVLNPPGRCEPFDLGEKGIRLPVTECLKVAAQRGAHGTIRRSADPDDLFSTIRVLASGGTVHTPAHSPEPEHHGAWLSPRELEVAAEVTGGHSNKQIADHLHITERTVKKHIGHILQKLALDDRLQIGLFFARNPLYLENVRVASNGNAPD